MADIKKMTEEEYEYAEPIVAETEGKIKERLPEIYDAYEKYMSACKELEKRRKELNRVVEETPNAFLTYCFTEFPRLCCQYGEEDDDYLILEKLNKYFEN